MTDAERRELVAFIADLRALEHDDKADLLIKLLDEIERLEKELAQVEAENEHHIRLAFVDAGANPAIAWKERAEKAERERDEAINNLALAAKTAERHGHATIEIERLAKDL